MNRVVLCSLLLAAACIVSSDILQTQLLEKVVAKGQFFSDIMGPCAGSAAKTGAVDFFVDSQHNRMRYTTTCSENVNSTVWAFCKQQTAFNHICNHGRCSCAQAPNGPGMFCAAQASLLQWVGQVDWRNQSVIEWSWESPDSTLIVKSYTKQLDSIAGFEMIANEAGQQKVMAGVQFQSWDQVEPSKADFTLPEGCKN